MIPEIPELSLHEVGSFQDLLKIRDYVFSVVPWNRTPFEGIGSTSIADLLRGFVTREIGGWCGLNAEYFQRILYRYIHNGSNLSSTRPYNFGLIKHKITHVGIVVTFDGMEFFLDPYLGVHYNHIDGFPLTFQALMGLISDRKFDRILPVYSNATKPVQTDSGWQMMTPQQMSASILATWPNYEKIMMETFGSTNPLLLMQIKIPG